MDFLNCVSTRRSVRKFTPAPIEHAVMERIVKAASYAPSWKNTQTARYVVVEDHALKDAIAATCVLDFPSNGRIIKGAPALVVLATVAGRSGYERDGTPSTSKGGGWEMFDAGIAAQTFCLAAHDEGLGTVIMGIFDDNKVAAALRLAEDQRVSALIAIGYPDEAPAMPKRKEVEQLLTYL